MSWLGAVRLYLIFITIANLVWEFAQIPLYTIWQTGTSSEILFAAVHCTGGDILIAMSCLIGSLCLLGSERWPTERFWPVALLTILTGLGYTIFSEWLNTEIRGAWAYGEWMPVIPIIGAGLSPFLQWIVLPIAGFVLVVRRQRKQRQASLRSSPSPELARL